MPTALPRVSVRCLLTCEDAFQRRADAGVMHPASVAVAAAVDFHADETAWPMAPGDRLPASLRVLLAEDCPTNQLLAGALLAHWGITPVVASNGAEAVMLATDHCFDIILMDIEMPVMDGLTATRHIRCHEQAHPERPRAHVVAYTAGRLARQPELLQRNGIDAVLPKPCDAGELGRRLRLWCAARTATSLQSISSS